MILKDLILKADPDKVAELLESKFEVTGVDIDNHLDVLERLKYIVPEPTTKNESLYMSEYEEELEDGTKYTDYDISRYTPDDEFTYQGMLFSSWAQWVGYPIHENTLLMYSTDMIVAMSLWELTFNSFDEDECNDFKNDVKNKIEEIKNGVIEFNKYDNVQEMLDDLKDKE